MPITRTDRMYEVSSVSRRMFRKRTIANTAIIPKAVIRLFDSTIITRLTRVGMMMSAFTKDRE